MDAFLLFGPKILSSFFIIIILDCFKLEVLGASTLLFIVHQ